MPKIVENARGKLNAAPIIDEDKWYLECKIIAKNGQLIQYAALIKKVPNKIIQTFVGIGKSFLIVIMMSCAHKI